MQQYVQYVHKKVNDLDKKVQEIENQNSNSLIKFIPTFFVCNSSHEENELLLITPKFCC